MAGEAIPYFFLGRATTACVITPMSIGVNGTLTAATDCDILGVVEDIEPIYENRNEDISPLTYRGMNEVPVESGMSYTINGVLLDDDATGDPTNLLANVIFSYDVFRLTLTRGKTGAGRTYTHYGCMRRYSERIVKGKTTFTFEVGPVAINGYNPVYT